MKVKWSLVLTILGLGWSPHPLPRRLRSSKLADYTAFLSFILLILIIGIMFGSSRSRRSAQGGRPDRHPGAITAASRIPFAALRTSTMHFLSSYRGWCRALAGAMVER